MNTIICQDEKSFTTGSSSGKNNEYNIPFKLEITQHVVSGGKLCQPDDLLSAIVILENLTDNDYDGDVSENLNIYTQQLLSIMNSWSDEQIKSYFSTDNISKLMCADV